MTLVIRSFVALVTRSSVIVAIRPFMTVVLRLFVAGECCCGHSVHRTGYFVISYVSAVCNHDDSTVCDCGDSFLLWPFDSL